MKILLINAPYMDVYGPDKKSLDSNFPLGLGYIASFLKKEGHTVFFLDPEAEGMSEIDFRKTVDKIQPDVAGITCVTYSFHNAKKIAQLIKQEINIPIVLGGQHASALPVEILKYNSKFDFIVIGEGEITMSELCKAIQNKTDLRGIDGICFREGDEIVRTNPRKKITDLSIIPFPARELVNLDNYKPNNQTSIGKRSASMITSRGCPFKCVFCSAHNVMGYLFRPYSPEYVVSEIEHLVNQYGIEHVAFKDDTFTFDKQRAKDICNRIIDKNIKIYWSCNASAHTVDYELLKLMKKAGCCAILYGIESGNPTVLKNMKKGITLDHARKALKISNAFGIKTLASFVFGLPGETRETIEDTINFAIELEPTIAMFYILVPLPGSEIFSITIKDKHKEITDWSSFAYTSTDYVIEIPGCSNKDLRKFIFNAYFRFYRRPKQLYKMILRLNSLNEVKTYIKGGIGLISRLLTLKTKSN